MNVDSILNYLITDGVTLVTKLAAALAIWIIGRWIISMLMKFVTKAFARGDKIDATMSRYITQILSAILGIGLFLGILGYLGVQTTSFAALIAGAGLAIGTAWGGLLTHLAAGLFLQILRPFKVGDYVTAGGVEGTVIELGLFGTGILTPDNVVAIVGNNKIFSDTIKNYSREAYRRVDCVAKVANTVDPRDAMARLRPVIAKIPNVIASPAPVIELLEFTPEGPRLCVRPFCHTSHYWQVYFDTNRTIAETFGAAAYPVPTTPLLYAKDESAVLTKN
jgi:small conductance mechanosensitive channel